MVAYGITLRNVQRPGWEQAYLNYGGLKAILEDMERLHHNAKRPSLLVYPSNKHAAVRQCMHRFQQLLQREIEKISLFVLQEEGKLATAIGTMLRIKRDGEMTSTNISTSTSTSILPDRSQPPTEGSLSQTPLLPSSPSPSQPPTPQATANANLSSNPSSNPSEVFTNGLSIIKDLGIASLPVGDAIAEADWNDVGCALGVELMHLLQFICLNAIGVRKIVKKHEKMIVRVMLWSDALSVGHDSSRRLQLPRPRSLPAALESASSDVEASVGFSEVDLLSERSETITMTQTSAVAAERGQIFNHANAINAVHLQHLANSESISALYTSLHTALLEEQQRVHSRRLEASHTDDQYSEMTPSRSQRLLHSASSSLHPTHKTSLLRFHYVMTSIQKIRKHADHIVNDEPFRTYLSRKAMILTGKNLGKIEGNALKALESMLVLEPSSIISITRAELQDWHQTQTYFNIAQEAPMECLTKEMFLETAKVVSREPSVSPPEGNLVWGGVDSMSLVINLLSTLLYTVNYYVVAPTANHYAILLGTDGAFGATLLGASSFAAIFAAFLYSYWYTVSSFRSVLIFSALCPLVGNLLYSLAISYHSMPMALVGRVLCGFGSAEVANRQLISVCVSFSTMTRASALFVAAGALGMSVGPLLAAILDMTSGRDLQVDFQLPFSPAGGIIYDHVTSPGFLMSVIWFVQLMLLIVCFREPERINGKGAPELSAELTETEGCASFGVINYDEDAFGIQPESRPNGEGDDEEKHYYYEDDVDDNVVQGGGNGDDNRKADGGPFGQINESSQTDFFRHLHSTTNRTDYGALGLAHENSADELISFQNATPPSETTSFGWLGQTTAKKNREKPKQGKMRTAFESVKFACQMLRENPALPLTLLLFGYIEMVDEVLISSCSMICLRYFGWPGSVAGLLIASLGSLVLPADFLVQKATSPHHGSVRYSERRIMKYSVLFLICSLIFILNKSAIWYDAVGIIENIDDESDNPERLSIAHSKVEVLLNDQQEFPYSSLLYIPAMSMVFLGTIVLESVDTSLMSKVTPNRLNVTFLNCGLMATLVGTVGRVVADSMITISAFLDAHIFVDFVNVTFLPLLLLTVIAYYYVRKYYDHLE